MPGLFPIQKSPVCYNGDLFTRGLCEKFTDRFPEIDTLMMGRGLIRNPALVRELQGGKRLEKEELQAFHDDLLAAYETVLSAIVPSFSNERTVVLHGKPV